MQKQIQNTISYTNTTKNAKTNTKYNKLNKYMSSK